MAQLQREGKVRWIGVSNFDVEQLQRAQAIAPITSLQPPYSLIRRDIEQVEGVMRAGDFRLSEEEIAADERGSH